VTPKRRRRRRRQHCAARGPVPREGGAPSSSASPVSHTSSSSSSSPHASALPSPLRRRDGRRVAGAGRRATPSPLPAAAAAATASLAKSTAEPSAAGSHHRRLSSTPPVPAAGLRAASAADVRAAAAAAAARRRQQQEHVVHLSDTSSYTGTHRHRFDAAGRGRGAAGRDLPKKGEGSSAGRYAHTVARRAAAPAAAAAAGISCHHPERQHGDVPCWGGAGLPADMPVGTGQLGEFAAAFGDGLFFRDGRALLPGWRASSTTTSSSSSSAADGLLVDDAVCLAENQLSDWEGFSALAPYLPFRSLNTLHRLDLSCNLLSSLDLSSLQACPNLLVLLLHGECAQNSRDVLSLVSVGPRPLFCACVVQETVFRRTSACGSMGQAPPIAWFLRVRVSTRPVIFTEFHKLRL
jgi:hypothetical protein